MSSVIKLSIAADEGFVYDCNIETVMPRLRKLHCSTPVNWAHGLVHRRVDDLAMNVTSWTERRGTLDLPALKKLKVVGERDSEILHFRPRFPLDNVNEVELPFAAQLKPEAIYDLSCLPVVTNIKVPWVQLRVRNGELRLAVTPASHVVWSVLFKSPADVDGQVRGCKHVQPPGSPAPDPTLREMFDEWVNRPEPVRTEWTPPTAEFWDTIAY